MNNRKDLKIPLMVLSVVILLLLIFGITYALYRNILIGTTNNIIKTGVIKFSYDEEISSTNGINLVNAFPMKDDIGKIMNGSNQYFDFSISCTTSLADIDYQILLEKQDGSDMPENYVKIYLTKLYSGNEMVVDSVLDDNNIKTYDMFNDEDNQKLIYVDTVDKGEANYIENYRLRMWIKYDSYDPEILNGKRFSVKVNVKASE